MRAYLRICEAACLLGSSTKTIRHFHKVGLIAEPQRIHARYRLYRAGDVLRIPRIRCLQALGLLLSRITNVLRATKEDRPLRRVLGRVADESDEQMRLLETRRERLRTLLAEETFDALHDSTEMPQIVELARAWLAE